MSSTRSRQSALFSDIHPFGPDRTAMGAQKERRAIESMPFGAEPRLKGHCSPGEKVVHMNVAKPRLAEGSDPVGPYSTGHNQVEVTQVGIDVERETVRGNPLADLHSHCGD